MAMIRMLEKNSRINQLLQKKENIRLNIPRSATLDADNQKEHISSAIQFDENAIEGRFARAAKNITVGTEIMVEKPFAAVLNRECSKTHCQHCFQRYNFKCIHNHFREIKENCNN